MANWEPGLRRKAGLLLARAPDHLTDTILSARKSVLVKLTQMTTRLADILDARLAELIGEGYEVRRIFASPADIEQLFRERGDSAILLDCDPGQDRAWYGQHELSPADSEGTMIMYCRGEECWIRDLARPEEPPAETLRAAS